MASTLRGGRSQDRVIDKGHGTGALGPGDTSDSGSDLTGAPGTLEGEVLGLDRGTNEDPETRGGPQTAGPDIGDAALDADADSTGTGERRVAGRDVASRADVDRKPDRIENVVGGGER